MKSIPWYKSQVLMTALLACLIQVVSALTDTEFLIKLLAGDPGAIARILGITVTAMVALLRAISQVQPISMGSIELESKALLIACLLLIPVSILTGCQTIRENPASAQLVTQYSVAKYLELKKTDADRYASATRIIKIAGDLKSVTGAGQVQLVALRSYLSSALAEQPLSPADRILANGLAELLLSELETRFYKLSEGGARDPSSPPGFLSPYQLMVVNDLLGWVISQAMTVSNPAAARPQ